MRVRLYALALVLITVVAGPAYAATAPSPAASPNPATGTVGVTTSPTLSWSASGATSYEIRFGTTSPPPTIVSSTPDYWYSSPVLNDGTTYYWQIVATNSGASTPGPVWIFTTARTLSVPPPPPPPPSPGSLPFWGTPAPIPGTIQAEDFDNGGEGVAYHDSSAGNTGGAYRSTDVDIQAASSGGYDVGWISAGEWLKYTVSVASSGTYSVTFRVASSGQGGAFHLEMNGTNVTGPLIVPDTGGWQNWQTVKKDVPLSAGQQVARLVMDSAGALAVGNFDSIQFTLVTGGVGGGGPPAPGSANPQDGTPGVTTTPNLSWHSAGATTYEVRFGTTNPPPTVVASQPDYWYPPPALSGGTKYYWQIVAKNSVDATSGPVWSFTTAGAPEPPRPPPPLPTPPTFRMMTWNIQSGHNAYNGYALPSQVQFMASQNADVIVLQEVSIYDEDQPTKYRVLLQQATGQAWYASWAPSCASGGCFGNLILSRIPMTSASMIFMPPSAAAQATISVAGVPVTIFTCHLDTNPVVRTQEENTLMSWARGFGGPRLVGGDFNAWWGESWIGVMETEYSDTWFDVTANRDGGYTKDIVRIDYIFRSFDGSSRVTPTNGFVPWTDLSDHRPFVADFKVQ